MPVVPTPISTSAVDLITGTFATNALLAGGISLTSAQSTILPSVITSASREIIRYCGRQFSAITYDEILTPEGGRQDRGEPASVKLSYFPVVSIDRVSTGRATVLTITNTDTSTNQLASVAFEVSGDVEYNDLSYTGLILGRAASGSTTTTSLSFAGYPTINTLATAINGLGNGWKASVASNRSPSPGLFSTTELAMHYPHLPDPNSHMTISTPPRGPRAAAALARLSSPQVLRLLCVPGSLLIERSDGRPLSNSVGWSEPVSSCGSPDASPARSRAATPPRTNPRGSLWPRRSAIAAARPRWRMLPTRGSDVRPFPTADARPDNRS